MALYLKVDWKDFLNIKRLKDNGRRDDIYIKLNIKSYG